MSGKQAGNFSFKHSIPWWIGQAVLYLLLWASLIKLPESPATGLDISWRMVVSQATAQRLQFGQDITFTYGPLGYLLAYVYLGRWFLVNWIWQIAGNLVIAAGLWRFGTALKPWRRALYYVYLFCFGSIFLDAMLMNFIAIFGLMLVRKEFHRPAWLAVIGGSYAIFSLVKFTSLFLCFFIIALATGYFISRRLKREILIFLGTFLVVFLAAWIGHGQSMKTLPGFFRYGLDVSLGYTGAMAEYESPLMFCLGLTTLLGVAVYGLLYFFSEADRPKAAVVAVVLAAVVFLNWKHGFTRADGHVLSHFILGLMIACSYPALTRDNGRWFVAKSTALGVTAAACVWGMVLFQPIIVTLAATSWNSRVRAALAAVGNLRANHEALDTAWKTAAKNAALKNIPGYVGGDRVTHMGDDQAYSLLNGLNFVPMPAIQSYNAWTPLLNRLDAEFLQSPRGPRYVIQRYRPLGSRLAPLEDSLSQKLLFQTYYYIMEEGGLILWERPADGEALVPGPEQPLLNKTVGFDEPVAVPDTGDHPVWAEVHVSQTLLGRLRQFVYKPPHLEFEARYADGGQERYRFVPALGAAGFILSPLFRNAKDVIAYQTGAAPRPVKQFSLHLAPGDAAYWKPQSEIVLRSISPFQRAATGLSVTTPHRFRMSNRAPIQLEAHVPPASIYINGEHLLHMHAPSRMEFLVPEGFSTLHARFGIMSNAYAGPNTTDGVEFTIDWLAPDGRTEPLFHRYLNPLQIAEDRGAHSFTGAFPQVKGGRLVFRTLPGPAGSPAFDWSYWTDIEIR